MILFRSSTAMMTRSATIQSLLNNTSRCTRIHSNIIPRPRPFASSSQPADYLCVHVFVTCKPGTQDTFQKASLANARESSQEEGIARFDIIQQEDDPCKFVLVEVYKDQDAPAKHKETVHYKVWRDTVADLMAEPRKAIKYRNIFPNTAHGWDYPKLDLLETK